MMGPALLLVASLVGYWWASRRLGPGPSGATGIAASGATVSAPNSLGSARIVFPDPGKLPAGALLPETVFWMASRTIQAHGFNARPALVAAMAYVESTYRPHLIGDEGASLGLMQVKLTTAQDLAENWGYRHLGVPSREDLFDPETSVYFAAGYLDWMRRYSGKSRTEEDVIQAYNVGPTAYFQRGARAGEYLSRVRSAEQRYITGG